LLGVAADTKADARSLRGMSHFAPGSISDADFAAAVRRGLDDLDDLGEVHNIGTEVENMPPPVAGSNSKR
jgi:hypothetical protein